MNALLEMLTFQPWVERLGQTLLHFLWQGAIIAVVYGALSQTWLRSCGSNKRYLAACLALTLMTLCPLATWGLIGSAAVVVPRLGGENTALLQSPVPLSTAPQQSGLLAAPVRAAASIAASETFMSRVVFIWIGGAAAFGIRLLGGWIAASRIRWRRVRPAPIEWQRILDNLRLKLRISVPVRLWISAAVPVPVVIGWISPIVLMPIGAIAGLPAEQVEALLLHELAHVRRYDYFVNLLQSTVEVLLFYHPAVWWISRDIRNEREYCCDDVAVSIQGDALLYAQSLAELESLRPVHSNTIAASGGSLAERIGRLLGETPQTRKMLAGPSGLITILLLVAAASLVFGQSLTSPRFETASIRPNATPPSQIRNPGSLMALPGGQLTAGWVVVRTLIQEAYKLRPYEVGEGPDWLDVERYDFNARMPEGAAPEQMPLILQTFLQDKFKLKVHREARELPVYVLSLAPGGPTPQPAKVGGCWLPNTFPPPTPPLPAEATKPLPPL